MSFILKRKDVPFHLVDPSPWPLLASLSAFNLTVGGVLYMHGYKLGGSILSIGFIALTLNAFLWWRDVVRESTFRGKHTKPVQNGLKNGIKDCCSGKQKTAGGFKWKFREHLEI